MLNPPLSHAHGASLEIISNNSAPIKFRFTKNYTDGNATKTLVQDFGVNLGFYAASDGNDNYT